MLIGISQHSLDEKGRINLPARLREVLQRKYDDRLVITLSARGITSVDQCLHIYPRAEFEILLEKVKAAPASDPAVMLYKRKVIGHAEECQIDKQGRVLIPALLREKVAIEKDTRLVGDQNLIELWSAAEWAKAEDVDAALIEYRDRLAQHGL